MYIHIFFATVRLVVKKSELRQCYAKLFENLSRLSTGIDAEYAASWNIADSSIT